MVRLTTWLERYIFVSWAIIAVCATAGAWWAFDRSPPFLLGSYTVYDAAPGQTMFINANVKRDLSRECSTRFSRYLYSNGVRHEISGSQYMSAAAIADMDKQMPDALRMAVRIPPDIVPGPATLVTALEYTCNPLHQVWPIDVLMRMNVRILP